MVGWKVTGLEPLLGTENQNISLTWYWSCFRSQSQACISPADWQRSVARLPAPWSDVQTAAPGETGQREERGLFINCHIGSHPECYFHPVIPATFLLKGVLVWLVDSVMGKEASRSASFPHWFKIRSLETVTLKQRICDICCPTTQNRSTAGCREQSWRIWLSDKQSIRLDSMHLFVAVAETVWVICEVASSMSTRWRMILLQCWYLDTPKYVEKNLTRYQIIKRKAELVNR